MQPHHVTFSLLASWLLALVLAGSYGNFGIPGWALLGVLGSLPLILALQIRREQEPTMSEAIRSARR